MDREEGIHKEKVNLLGKYEINLRTNFVFLFFVVVVVGSTSSCILHSALCKPPCIRKESALRSTHIFVENK